MNTMAPLVPPSYKDASHLSVDGAQVTKWVPRDTSHLARRAHIWPAELTGSSKSVKGTHMKLSEPAMWWCLYFHMDENSMDTMDSMDSMSWIGTRMSFW